MTDSQLHLLIANLWFIACMFMIAKREFFGGVLCWIAGFCWIAGRWFL